MDIYQAVSRYDRVIKKDSTQIYKTCKRLNQVFEILEEHRIGFIVNVRKSLYHCYHCNRRLTKGCHSLLTLYVTTSGRCNYLYKDLLCKDCILNDHYTQLIVSRLRGTARPLLRRPTSNRLEREKQRREEDSIVEEIRKKFDSLPCKQCQVLHLTARLMSNTSD